VAHNHRDAVGTTLRALMAQLREDDELIVIDNGSADGTPRVVREAAPAATVIEVGKNLGFAAGCNRGAALAVAELLLFLNPDAVVAPGFRDAIELPLTDGRGWAAWQGLVTAEGGRVINSRGGAIHFTGIAWAGGAGELVPAAEHGGDEPVPEGEPGFVSGACFAIPASRFEDAGGFAERFFLYHEDVDLSLRLRLVGGRLGFEPRARADHDYEFVKGPAKWRLLERNRWATLIRTYPATLLALLAPALLATEVALVPISIVGGWARPKALSWLDVVRWLPRLLRERSEIQATRRLDAGAFARSLTPDLGSSYLDAAGRSRLLRAALRAYWSVVLALLRA
jgi:GT2 family glycosyltransferase